ncbi:MAG: hypothetical protein ACRC6A_12155 [Fusobacteriaceae bacterium]
MKNFYYINRQNNMFAFNFYFIFSTFISSKFLILLTSKNNNFKIVSNNIFNISFKRSESYISI